MARRPIDIVLLVAVLILLLFSVCFVFTASVAKAEHDTGDAAFFLKRQLVRLAIGLIMLFLFSRIDYRKITNLAPPVYWLLLAVLIGLLFAPDSWMIRGSRVHAGAGPLSVIAAGCFAPGSSRRIF